MSVDLDRDLYEIALLDNKGQTAKVTWVVLET